MSGSKYRIQIFCLGGATIRDDVTPSMETVALGNCLERMNLSLSPVQSLSGGMKAVGIIKAHEGSRVVAYDENDFGISKVQPSIDALRLAEITCVGIPSSMNDPESMRRLLEPTIIQLLANSDRIRLEGGGYRVYGRYRTYTDHFDDGAQSTIMRYNSYGLLDGGTDENGYMQPAIVERVSGSDTLWRYCYYRNGKKTINQFGVHEVWLSCLKEYPVYSDINGEEISPRKLRILLPEGFSCPGDYSIAGQQGDIWPDKISIKGKLNASRTNIKTWRSEWYAEGGADLSFSSLERIELGCQFWGVLNISNTPISFLPPSTGFNGSVVAHNTPNLRIIWGKELHFKGDLDLTGSAIEQINPDTVIDGDFIVSNTKKMKWSPACLRVGGDFIARNTNLEEVSHDTFIEGLLDLTGSRVLFLDETIRAREGIIGRDGKKWETVKAFNEHYANYDLPPLPPPERREIRFRPRVTLVNE